MHTAHKCQTGNRRGRPSQRTAGDHPEKLAGTNPNNWQAGVRFDLTIVGGTHVVAAPSCAGLAFVVSEVAQGGTWVHLQRFGAKGMGVASRSSLLLTPPSQARHSPGAFSSTDYILSPDGIPPVARGLISVSHRLLRRGPWCFRRKRCRVTNPFLHRGPRQAGHSDTRQGSAAVATQWRRAHAGISTWTASGHCTERRTVLFKRVGVFRGSARTDRGGLFRTAPLGAHRSKKTTRFDAHLFQRRPV